MTTLAEYVRDPAPSPSLSASIAHILLTQSARHAWLAHPRLNPMWQPEEAEHMDLGTIAHALLLEGDESRVVVVEAADWRTNLAKAARDDARAQGKLPILRHKMEAVNAMVAAAKDAIQAAPEIRKAFDAGKAEQTLIWREGDAYCRCRPDWITDDYRLLIDVKTTGASAEPDSWARGSMLSLGYDLQGAFQLRGVRQLYKPREASFINMVIETEPPYAVSFVGLSPEFEAFAESKRAAALARWIHCLETDAWPGYPERICWALPPAWAMARFEESLAVGGTVGDL